MKSTQTKPIHAHLIGMLAIAGLAFMTSCSGVDSEDDDEDRTITTETTIERNVISPPVTSTVETSTYRSY